MTANKHSMVVFIFSPLHSPFFHQNKFTPRSLLYLDGEFHFLALTMHVLPPKQENIMEYVEISKVRPFAVVTDASSGIGYELALQFAVNGFDLLIAAKGEGLFEAQEKLQEITDRVEAVQVDLATYKGVEELLSLIHIS